MSETSEMGWHETTSDLAGEPEPVPKVTPYLLRRADTMCPRRLALDYRCARGTPDPVSRARMRGALLDAVRAAHADGGLPRAELLVAPGHLEPEEQAVLAQAARWYLELYGDRPRRVADDVPVDEPTLLPRREVRLGGWVDLVLAGPAGERELRQLDLWGGGPSGVPADPLDVPAVKAAVLRLAQVGFARDGELLVGWCDPVHGARAERTLDVAAELPGLADWLDERLGALHARADEAVPEPGADCGSCRHVPGCPAHQVKGGMQTRKAALVPSIVSLSPTALETWRRCRREWRNRYALGVPASDASGSPDHGLELHALLRHVHEHGSCVDAAWVTDVLDGHGADERTREEVARHVRRCPAGAEALGHEHDVARAGGRPPVFVATARIDALWAYDGVLDARDYKSGQVHYPDLAEDPRARVQAWALEPVARERGLRLRLRYEHLAAEVADDPDPWEPDAEQLAEIGDELRAVVAGIHAHDRSRDWTGAADPGVCGRCDYRSICPESATPSEPIWPVVGPDDAPPDPALADADG